MSTAALIKSISDHAVRQRQQLRWIQDDMEVLTRALADIVRLGTEGQRGGDSDALIRGVLVRIAKDAILSIYKEAECELP